jgi:hypothetical protein
MTCEADQMTALGRLTIRIPLRFILPPVDKQPIANAVHASHQIGLGGRVRHYKATQGPFIGRAP